MKQLRKIADIDPRTAPPVWRRHPHQSTRILQWLIDQELTGPQLRIVERYQENLVARLHPQRARIELYIDPAAVGPNDSLVIELVFKR
jgi:hypothetical protein